MGSDKVGHRGCAWGAQALAKFPYPARNEMSMVTTNIVTWDHATDWASSTVDRLVWATKGYPTKKMTPAATQNMTTSRMNAARFARANESYSSGMGSYWDADCGFHLSLKIHPQ